MACSDRPSVWCDAASDAAGQHCGTHVAYPFFISFYILCSFLVSSHFHFCLVFQQLLLLQACVVIDQTFTVDLLVSSGHLLSKHKKRKYQDTLRKFFYLFVTLQLSNHLSYYPDFAVGLTEKFNNVRSSFTSSSSSLSSLYRVNHKNNPLTFLPISQQLLGIMT